MERNEEERREGKGGISPRALTISARGEAPDPGAERAAWSSDLKVAGSRSPTGASLPKGRALEVVRCPLCGKLVRKHSAPQHALSHLEKLERCGMLQLFRENGGWVVVRASARARTKHVGAGWTTLCRLAKEGVMVSG
jgi:hypothetical protein